jgi:protein tyrosine phosphatase (PTP) superfamily phosphohydrolase (DUF442 family)
MEYPTLHPRIVAALSLPFLVACATGAGPREQATLEPVAVAGCENVYRAGEALYSGGQPMGEEAFRDLAALGVKTVISVDGARPAVELAGKYGMRYVHLPIGYDGIPRDRVVELSAALEALPKPVYVHCHHGKHRGPAAAAVALMGAEGWSPEAGEALLAAAGTSPKYPGLFAAVRGYVPPAPGERAAVQADALPAVAPLPAFTEAMAQVDRTFDRLEYCAEADWGAPPDHPDVNPPHEARQMAELFAEIHRAEAESGEWDARFVEMLRESAEAAADLEAALARGDHDAAQHAYVQLGRLCGDCHDDHRNAAMQ